MDIKKPIYLLLLSYAQGLLHNDFQFYQSDSDSNLFYYILDDYVFNESEVEMLKT